MKRAVGSILVKTQEHFHKELPRLSSVPSARRILPFSRPMVASTSGFARDTLRFVSSSSKKQPSTTSKRKVSVVSLLAKKRKDQRISVVTAYDYPSALHVGQAGVDICLVGDSLAMVELGHETTQKVTLDMMIHHCQAASRGLKMAVQQGHRQCMLVGDMPFGTYEYQDTDIALRAAYEFVQRGDCDAVKLEGGTAERAKTVKRIVDGGIAVMGHIGLTPQAVSVIGGFRAQGRTADQAQALLEDALRLQDAGCFSIVLECVPANVAASITERLDIPTIGIGAGGGTSGQVLVYHDMLGLLSSTFVPKFCKQYAQVGTIIQEGLEAFKADVESGVFPGDEYSPYAMSEGEQKAFDAKLQEFDSVHLTSGAEASAEARGCSRPPLELGQVGDNATVPSSRNSESTDISNDGIDLYGGSANDGSAGAQPADDEVSTQNQQRA